MFVLLLIASLSAVAVGQPNLCAAPNGDFPNPSSEQCTTYLRCFQGTPILLRCPANQRFEFLFRVCRPQAEVDCTRQLEVFAAPSVIQNIGSLGGLSNLGGLAGAGIGGLGGGLAGGLGGGLAGGLGGGLGGAGTFGGGGLPNGGLINLLSQLDGGDGDGNNANNGLATVLALTAIMNQRNAGASRQGFQGPIAGQLQSAPPLLPATSNQWQQPQTFGSPVNPGTVSLAGQGTPFTTDDGRTFLFYPQFANLQLAPGGDLGTSQGNNNNQDQGFRRGPGNGQWRRKHLVQRQLNSGRGQGTHGDNEGRSSVLHLPNIITTDDSGIDNKTNTTSSGL